MSRLRGLTMVADTEGRVNYLTKFVSPVTLMKFKRRRQFSADRKLYGLPGKGGNVSR